MHSRHRLPLFRPPALTRPALLLTVVIGTWALASHAAAAAATTEAPASAPAPAADPVYRVGRGDELSFKFLYTPELNTTATVRPDGKLTLPLLGELQVAGQTLQQLGQQVEAALAPRVRRPQVAINLQGSVTSQRVFIGGEVVRPGVQPLLGPLTVLQAVMVAEGLKDGAQAREVIVLRNDAQGERQVLRLDLKAVMAGQDGANDITLSPYDVVIVPRSGIANLGLWVDQYIRRVLPINLGFSYTVNRNGALQ
jgi:protein involved in polysaccharide export with SLBB domain